MLPSGPAVMPASPAFDPIPVENGVMTPVGVTRTILFAPVSTNHTLPSGPSVIASGPLPEAIGYSVMFGAAQALGAAIARTSADATAAPRSLARYRPGTVMYARSTGGGVRAPPFRGMP